MNFVGSLFYSPNRPWGGNFTPSSDEPADRIDLYRLETPELPPFRPIFTLNFWLRCLEPSYRLFGMMRLRANALPSAFGGGPFILSAELHFGREARFDVGELL